MHEGEAAADFTINIPGTSRDVGEVLSTTHAKHKAPSRHYLLKVAHNIQFLSRQGIGLCGDGPETDSNYVQQCSRILPVAEAM